LRQPPTDLAKFHQYVQLFGAPRFGLTVIDYAIVLGPFRAVLVFSFGKFDTKPLRIILGNSHCHAIRPVFNYWTFSLNACRMVGKQV
jgi:hypothetical protein